MTDIRPCRPDDLERMFQVKSMGILRPFPVLSASVAIAVTLQTGMAAVTNSVLQSEPVLMGSPLALDQIQEIIPLGNLNPAGGHVFPTDHIYFDYHQKAGLMVLAPAGGTVRSIRTQSRGDLKIEIQVDTNVDYYLAHFANARPDPLFRYRSKSWACSMDSNATYTLTFHGTNVDV